MLTDKLKKAFASKREKKREEDRKLTPVFNLRVHDALRISELPFLIAPEDKLVEAPSSEVATITGIGNASYDDARLLRLYFNDDTTFAEIAYEGGTHPTSLKDIEDVTVYRRFDVVEPESEEEWQFWLDEEEGAFGNLVFTLEDDGTEVEYTRLMLQEQPFLAPIFIEESLEHIEDNREIEHHIMHFGRTLSDGETVEYLLLDFVDDNNPRIELSLGLTAPLKDLVD